MGDGGGWVGEDAPEHLKSRADRRGRGTPWPGGLCVGGYSRKPAIHPLLWETRDRARESPRQLYNSPKKSFLAAPGGGVGGGERREEGEAEKGKGKKSLASE